MVVLSSLEEWQKQSALLLEARPSTARVTTKYNIPNLSSSAYTKTKPSKKEQEDEGYGTDKDKTVQPRIPRATITLKTYDPVSGVTLKFKTDRAADVGRTIAGLGNLGRQMAALPPKAEVKDVVMDDAPTLEAAKTATDVPADVKTTQPSNSGGTNANKKKKKGKK